MKTIFITGGAGYLGTNISLVALNKGYKVVILDNFRNAYTRHINKLKRAYPDSLFVHKGDVNNSSDLKYIFEKYTIDYIIHLAAYKYVGESISNKDMYYTNNMGSLEKILAYAEKYKIEKFAFASSAVVYGNPESYPTSEENKLCPLSPYAETKALGEEMIKAWNSKTGITSIIYRFSNPIGAEPTYLLGDDSKKGVLNLLPYIVTRTLNKESMEFKGNNHDTHDGTAVRDYIYICDLAKAVISLLENYNDKPTETINVSRAKGFSVLDILKAVERSTRVKANYSFRPKNPGEASISLLSADKLHSKYQIYLDTDISEIVDSEIKFRKNTQKKK